MDSTVRTNAVEDARSVGYAATALLRKVRSDQGDVEAALERLELNAGRAIDNPVQGFDTGPGGQLVDEDVLAVALSQLEIGNTLLAAESALASPEESDRLGSALVALDGTADALEAEDAASTLRQGFDTSPGGTPLPVIDAARAALDEMAAAAAQVATAVLDKTLQPILKHVPDPLPGLAGELDLDIPGRLTRLGLRAVRRGLDLLLRLVDLQAVARVRDQIDQVLAQLGRGEDAAVLAGWAIGADAVRTALTGREPGEAERSALTRELADLTQQFLRRCLLLRRVAVAVAGLAATLALFHVVVPQALALTTLGLVLVLGAVVLLGRDYTGANDLPGRVRGVRLVVAVHDAPA